jgi:perosamine synthetase
MPTTAFPLSLLDIAACSKVFWSSDRFITEFESQFARFIGVKHAFLVDSGTAAFYVVIRAFHHLVGKKEVILPAYTVPTLTLAVGKAKLKTRLCDISKETFNLDHTQLDRVITRDTLCVVPVHMFGYPCAMDPIQQMLSGKDIFVFEDACQAPGARLDAKMVGSIGDAACFSLCKGKNFSTFSGGIATTNSDDLAERIRIEREALPSHGAFFGVLTVCKLIGLSVAMRPFFYKVLYPFIEPFKSTQVHTKFDPMRYTEFQSVIGKRLLGKIEMLNRIRGKNGARLIDALKSFDSLITPQIIDGAEPVFNHLPVVFKNRESIEPIRMALWRKGIDTARMYERPIHHIYDLGYDGEQDPFPNATYVAERLVTLPTHPYLKDKDLKNIIEVFSEFQ